MAVQVPVYCPRCPNRKPCPVHQRQDRQHESRFYRHAATAYNRVKWIRIRDEFRAEHPFCINAEKGVKDCRVLTRIVDHKVPHRGDERLMYSVENLQPMCWPCHSKKTRLEVGFAQRKQL